jgi:phosphate transport system permease protein
MLRRMIWVVFLALFAFSFLAYGLGRKKAAAGAVGPSSTGRPRRAHSLPGYHGALAALWATVPAFLILCTITAFGDRIETAVLTAEKPAAVRALEPDRQQLFIADAISRADGGRGSEASYPGELKAPMAAAVARAHDIRGLLMLGSWVLTGVLALAGFLLVYRRLNPELRARNRVEGWVSVLLLLCSTVAVLTTVGIVASLVWESLRFFSAVSPIDFLTGLHWSPQIAMRSDQVGSSGSFGAVPLFMGTFLVMLIAMIVAAPVGLFSAIYLSEYAGKKTRAWVKPLLEILAGVPTVVYGFFAALTVGPAFRFAFNALGATMIGGPLESVGLYLGQVQNQMALVAGVVMGIMLIPFVSSLSDDIINAVPQSLRDGSYALGATKSETVKKVVLPAALPGVVAALLLAVSRAIGETMIVTMAAGLQAKATLNPLESVTTVTVQIVTLLTGDQEFDSPKTLAAFGLGLTLFVVTLILNIIALRIVRHYREQYD